MLARRCWVSGLWFGSCLFGFWFLVNAFGAFFCCWYLGRLLVGCFELASLFEGLAVCLILLVRIHWCVLRVWLFFGLVSSVLPFV